MPPPIGGRRTSSLFSARISSTELPVLREFWPLKSGSRSADTRTGLDAWRQAPQWVARWCPVEVTDTGVVRYSMQVLRNDSMSLQFQKVTSNAAAICYGWPEFVTIM